MPAPSTTTLAVEITIPVTDSIRAYLDNNASESNLSAKLSSWVAFFLESYAAGGFMVQPEDARYIREITKLPALNSKKVVEVAEAATNREQGQMSIRISIDPSYIEPLKEIAHVQGRETATEMLQDFVNDMITQSFGYNLQPDFQVNLTRAQKKELEGILGKKQIFGDDLFNYIKRASKAKAA